MSLSLIHSIMMTFYDDDNDDDDDEVVDELCEVDVVTAVDGMIRMPAWVGIEQWMICAVSSSKGSEGTVCFASPHNYLRRTITGSGSS
jgi:hypothetical protein